MLHGPFTLADLYLVQADVSPRDVSPLSQFFGIISRIFYHDSFVVRIYIHFQRSPTLPKYYMTYQNL